MNNKLKILKNLALITQIGFIFITTILLSIFLGNEIDKFLNSGIIFKIIFIIIGVISVYLSVYRIIMNSIKNNK